MQVVLYLAVTLGVFVLAWLAARLLSGRVGRTGSRNQRLQVMERVMVGKDRQIAVVRAGSRVFLVGIAGQSVQIGPTLDPDDFLPDGEPGMQDDPVSHGKRPVGPTSFADLLRQAGIPLPGKGKDREV